MRNKVRAMSKMMTMLKNLREDSENIVQIKGDGKLHQDLLKEDRQVAETDIAERKGLFSNAKKLDYMNEGMPFK